MSGQANALADAARAGVFHLGGDPRAVAQAAADAGLAVLRIDIGHAHDKQDFLGHVAKAFAFPEGRGASWESLPARLQDLSWSEARGWVLILEKSKHFCAGHRHAFEEAMQVMDAAARHWRERGKPFWTLIAGPDGWQSGWPDWPAA